MTATGLAVFDRTLHKTNAWLKEISQEMGWEEQAGRQDAYHGLRATLHAVRDRLVPDEAIDLGAQLPLLIRGMYYENWQPARTPQRIRDREEFLARVREEYDGQHEATAEALVRASLDTLARHVSPGEMAQVKDMFPADLRDLWTDH